MTEFWTAHIGENFEAWLEDLNGQAKAAGMHFIGAEIFKPLADKGDVVIVRTMYIAPNLNNIPKYVGPFQRDMEAPRKYVKQETKEGPIIVYYAMRKTE
jgi:hypothetical protein